MRDIFQGLVGQLIALLTFFAFPAIQNLWLKAVSSRDGAANLSFSPRYGFRVAVANQFGKRVLADIRWRALLRRVRPSPDSRRLGLSDDTQILDREDFFLFPGGDQILVAFKLRRANSEVHFVPTSVVGIAGTHFLWIKSRSSSATSPLRLRCDSTLTTGLRSVSQSTSLH